MAKTKKPKAPKSAPNLKPQFALTKEQVEAQPKKKKKNAPDKPQPEWMFPPDEENPVLNPKVKTEEQKKKEKEEHDASIDYLQHKKFSAPMRPAPPGILLSLVGAFLTSYGFDGASRLYTTHLKARKQLGDWDFEVGQQIPKGYPNLVKIFKDFHKDFQEAEETSSSDSDDSDGTKAEKQTSKMLKAKKAAKAAIAIKDKDTSSSEDSGEYFTFRAPLTFYGAFERLQYMLHCSESSKLHCWVAIQILYRTPI